MNKFDRALDQWLENLARRAQLVVFSEFCFEKLTKNEWINRRNEVFWETKKFYESFDDEGKRASQIFNDCESVHDELTHSLLLNVIPITCNHGELKLGVVGHDTDPKVAHYATTNGAMAIFTKDTDFMIYDGLWKFWSYVDIDFERFKVKEFDRLLINQVLSLTFEQLPLLATLMGSSFTKKYWNELHNFHRELERNARRYKFHNVTQYIRQIFNEQNFTLDDIDEIAKIVAQDVFGENSDDEKRQAIIDSIKSYDIVDFKIEDIEGVGDDDEMNPNANEIRLSIIQWNSASANIHYNINAMQRLKWIYLQDDEQSNLLNGYFAEMMRKQVGLVDPDCFDETFELIVKKSMEESYQIYDESPIFPHCERALK